MGNARKELSGDREAVPLPPRVTIGHTEDGAVHLRPATTRDLQFCNRVNETNMRPLVEELGSWSPFMFIQRFDHRDFEIVEVGDEPAGILKAVEEGSDLYLGEIQLVPRFHRRGIGRIVMEEVFKRARNLGKPVRLQVLTNNPARYFYYKLGFAVDDSNRWHWIMRWTGN